MPKVLNLTLLFLLLVQGTLLNGQSDSIQRINQIIKEIEADTSLTVWEFDTNEVYNQVSDGGGVITLWFDSSGIKEIYQEIGISYGRLITIIYFDNGKPIKIVEQEENFEWVDDIIGWNYSKIKRVFQVEIYVFNWDTESFKINTEGKRLIEKKCCTRADYMDLIELGKKLLNK